MRFFRAPTLRAIKPCALCLALALCQGCFGSFQNPFSHDPLTGGVNSERSVLLDIPFPAGMQTYPSHGYVDSSTLEGLETLRGYVNPNAAALAFYNNLTANGWRLLTRPRKGDRAVYLYRRDEKYAVLTFRKQGALTIIEIWVGDTLPPGSGFSPPLETPAAPPVISHDAREGEEYGPIGHHAGTPAEEEKFGSTLEEREL